MNRTSTLSLRRAVSIGLTSSLLLAACAAAPASTPSRDRVVAAPLSAALDSPMPAPVVALPKQVPFEIVAQDAPFVGPETGPIALAIRGSDTEDAHMKGLPEEAAAALHSALAESDSALYIVIYAGIRPSSGYAVRVDSIVRQVDGGKERLVVNYSLDEPDPDKGAATVLTHPYVIVRVSDVQVDTAEVIVHGP